MTTETNREYSHFNIVENEHSKCEFEKLDIILKLDTSK